ncbi:hypothetical protein [Microcoleus sp. AR_TQ3_B6]|uniref:hypothetical protein n=1 Tax=Microcoleus sp. AR_TQ3_B6 TaxID=3055284 RepID=UPI002FD71EBD
MGTLNLGRDILRTSGIPGGYMDEKNLRCSSYYTYFAQYLLNNIISGYTGMRLTVDG